MSQIVRQRSVALQRFTGGLNNYWDQSSIDDAELASIINLEFTTSGAMISRPPIYGEMSGATAIESPVTTEPFDIIGTYTRNDGERYLVAVTNAKTWIYNITSKLWTEIWAHKASDCTQFQNKIVLSSLTEHGGYWEAGTFTVTNMPYLGGIELFQNRFFGYGVQGTSTANTMYWSDITTFGPSGETTSVWDWIDETGNYYYVDIGSGDGQWITAMAQGYNDIVLFRNKSTYRYSFGEDPAGGQMQVMQQDVGAENKRCAVKFENAHFVFSGGILYRYQNWLYYPLNARKVKFESYTNFTQRFEHAISVVGRRILVWHQGSMFAYNLDTETWSEWETDTRAGYFVAVARKDEDNVENLYYGVSGDVAKLNNKYSLLRVEDNAVSLVGAESFKCFLRTKIYDFDSPVEWKRLYFWAADVASARPIKAVVYPVALTETVVQANWDEVSKDFDGETAYYTWDQLSKDDLADTTYGTWDSIVTPSGGIATVVSSFPQTAPQRIEAKLNNALRFRRIYFELYLESDGTASTAPVQIYSITPMVGAKATVTKGAN